MLDPQNLKLQKRNSSSSWQRAMMLPPKGLSGLINSLIRAGPIEIHGSLHMILVSNTNTVCTSDYINSYCISTRVMINKVSSLLPFNRTTLVLVATDQILAWPIFSFPLLLVWGQTIKQTNKQTKNISNQNNFSILVYPLVVGETMEKSEQLVAAAERDPYPSLNPQNQCSLTAHHLSHNAH